MSSKENRNDKFVYQGLGDLTIEKELDKDEKPIIIDKRDKPEKRSE